MRPGCKERHLTVRPFATQRYNSMLQARITVSAGCLGGSLQPLAETLIQPSL